MIYDHTNTQPGCRVIDVDTSQKLPNVASVDMDKLEVVQYCQPFIVDVLTGKIKRESTRFKSIIPVFVGRGGPGIFQCHGMVTA